MREFMRIKLADDQIKELKPVFDEVDKYHIPGVKSGSAIAQVKCNLETRSDGVLIVGFIDKENTEAVAEILATAFKPGNN